MAWLLNPIRRKGIRGRKNLPITENLALCASCAAVLGYAMLGAIPRITAMPFQLLPMTVPVLPEKPPKIPCLIVLMIVILIVCAPTQLDFTRVVPSLSFAIQR